MDKGFVQLPLDVYHEYLKMEQRWTDAEKELTDLRGQIKDTYRIKTTRSIMFDPLAPDNADYTARVIIDKEKLQKLFEIASIPNVKIIWEINQ